MRVFVAGASGGPARGHGGGGRPAAGAFVHRATALADLSDLKHFDREFRHTNVLPPGARTR